MSMYSPPRREQHAYLGNRGDKTNSFRQIIPTFVTALSYYPTRWACRLREVDTRTVGVLPSHLSSLKAAHHWGNRKINIDSAANLCIHQCWYMERFVCRRSPLARLRTQDSHQPVVYRKWFYLNINMCTKVQATVAHF